MRKSVNDPFAQAATRKKDPNRKSWVTQAIEAGEAAAKRSKYLEDTIAILNNNQSENQNADELRAVLNEVHLRLNNYNNQTID